MRLSLRTDDAGSSQSVNLAPRLAVGNKLAEYDKVEEHSSEAAYEPTCALDEVLALG